MFSTIAPLSFFFLLTLTTGVVVATPTPTTPTPTTSDAADDDDDDNNARVPPIPTPTTSDAVERCLKTEIFYDPGYIKVTFDAANKDMCYTQECINSSFQNNKKINMTTDCKVVEPCKDRQFLSRRDGECCQTCMCERGFHRKDNLRKDLESSFICIDVDECSNSKMSACGAGTKCNNTAGSYTCDCKEGYEQRINSTHCATFKKIGGGGVVDTSSSSSSPLLSSLSSPSSSSSQQRSISSSSSGSGGDGGGGGDYHYYYYYYNNTEFKKQLLQGSITAGICLFIFTCIFSAIIFVKFVKNRND